MFVLNILMQFYAKHLILSLKLLDKWGLNCYIIRRWTVTMHDISHVCSFVWKHQASGDHMNHTFGFNCYEGNTLLVGSVYMSPSSSPRDKTPPPFSFRQEVCVGGCTTTHKVLKYIYGHSPQIFQHLLYGTHVLFY